MSEYLAAVLNEPQTVNPILRHLGIRVEHAQDGAATLRLEAGKDTAQGAGMVSGGVISTLLDEAMAHAVLSGQKELRPIATVDLHVQFISGARPGSVLVCDAEVVKNGGRIAFVRAQANTPDGRLVATATASFIVK
ncbi:MAG: PaaI family thioesterase [Halodesulfovibrio sp.]